jgi:V/A-type H+-transporting ATPase subunit F
MKATVSSDSQTARSALQGYARDEEVSLVIITERLAEQIRNTIEEISLNPYPVIVEIPDKRGRLEDKENPLRRLVKRAIGVELEGF